MEDVIEFKSGRKVVVQKKVFPGYLLVRMELDDDSWYVVRNTPGVTGFVGQRRQAHAAVAPRGRGHPRRRQGRRRRGAREEGAAPARVRDRRAGAGGRRPVRRLQRRHQRDRRRPLEAQGAGQHLRPGDPGRARVRPGREALGARRERSDRQWQRSGWPRWSRSRSRPGRRRRRRRWAPRSGPHGINIMDFCKAYNAADRDAARAGHPGRDLDLRGPVVHVRHQDPAHAVPAEAGGRRREGRRRTPASRRSGQFTKDQVRQIAETKMPDLNAVDLEGAMQQVEGTARPMGSRCGSRDPPRQEVRRRHAQVRPRAALLRRPRRSSS